MRVINVIEISNNSLLDMDSFGVIDEEHVQEVVDVAEKHFIDRCRVNGADEDEFTDDDLLDDAFYDNGIITICIHWTEIND